MTLEYVYHKLNFNFLDKERQQKQSSLRSGRRLGKCKCKRLVGWGWDSIKIRTKTLDRRACTLSINNRQKLLQYFSQPPGRIFIKILYWRLRSLDFKVGGGKKEAEVELLLSFSRVTIGDCWKQFSDSFSPANRLRSARVAVLRFNTRRSSVSNETTNESPCWKALWDVSS